MKRIFLLDMDDTLLDFHRGERENLTQTLARFGIKVGDALYERFHAINDGLWKALERGEIERDALKLRRFELLSDEFGLGLDVPAVSLAYWQNFPSICFPFPGAAKFLQELSARGKIYLVTNGGSMIQSRHIELAGFSPYFSGVFISEKIGANKPSAAFADYVEAHIPGYCRAEAVWIGDSLTSDGLCAETRGIDFLRFDPFQDSERMYRTLLESIDRM